MERLEPAHLLNTRAHHMSIWPDQPNDFVRWLSAFLGREIATDEFVARSDYGRYLEAALSPSLDSGRLDWYQDECVSLQPQDGVLRLELKQMSEYGFSAPG